MTTEVAAVEPLAVHSQADLAGSTRTRILLYLGVLTLMVGVGAPFGGLFSVPISFFLKNKLHFSSHQVAEFQLVAAIPLYLSFLWGFVRDTWNPFGLRDRGFLLIFGLLTAAAYVGFAFVPPTAFTLGAAVIVLTSCFLFTQSALYGLNGVIGKRHVMSGQISAVWNIVGSLPILIAYGVGGFLSDALESKHADQAARTLFMVGAAIMAAVALFALWRPKAVYDNLAYEKSPFHPIQDVARLLRHWPVYPALLVWTLWNFAPGSGTPLQFYMQDTLRATDDQWGLWNAIFTIGFIPTFLLFGLLCRYVKLGPLIFWGTLVGVPQMVPLLFIHTPTEGLIAAFPIGLMGGVCSAALIDLLIRSAPKGLEGTILMMSTACYYIVSQAGNLLGTALYDQARNLLGAALYQRFGGFLVCVIAITVVYALILPALLLVPKRLLATADGQSLAEP
jgi:hypothetical protein